MKAWVTYVGSVIAGYALFSACSDSNEPFPSDPSSAAGTAAQATAGNGSTTTGTGGADQTTTTGGTGATTGGASTGGAATSMGGAAMGKDCGATTCADDAFCCPVTDGDGATFRLCTPSGVPCSTINTAWDAAVNAGPTQPCNALPQTDPGWASPLGTDCATGADCCSGNCQTWSDANDAPVMKCSVQASMGTQGPGGTCLTKNDCNQGLVCCSMEGGLTCQTRCDRPMAPMGGAGGMAAAAGAPSAAGAPTGGASMGGTTAMGGASAIGGAGQ